MAAQTGAGGHGHDSGESREDQLWSLPGPRGRRRDDLEARVRTFFTRGFGDRILAFDVRTAGVYGEIFTARQSAGRPIDAFDAMIAAIARSRAATIATRNIADFDGCGVAILDPWKD